MPTPATKPAPSPAPDEIARRVAENDTARSTRRAAAARRVGELARQHAAIAGQLTDIERQLGAVLAEAEDVLTLSELAKFTDVPAAALNQWRANHKPKRAKRRKTPPLNGPHAQRSPASAQRATTPGPAAQQADAEARGRAATVTS